MLRLLIVTAHPDDEAGAFGGSLLLYHERGVETYVTCLTAGQAASNRGGAESPTELMAMRRKEFARSCEILKVTHGEVLDFPDGALDRTDFYSIVERVTRRVREIRPHVMLTFGTEGGVTAHPDHSMASLIATAAFHWAGRSSRFTEQLKSGLKPHFTQKLYYHTARMPFPDREPVALAPASVTIDVGRYVETKLEAFKAHTTQNPLYERVAGRLRKLGTEEWFLLVATRQPQKINAETDLFEGVAEA